MQEKSLQNPENFGSSIRNFIKAEIFVFFFSKLNLIA
jgi:hypothetical protein